MTKATLNFWACPGKKHSRILPLLSWSEVDEMIEDVWRTRKHTSRCLEKIERSKFEARRACPLSFLPSILSQISSIFSLNVLNTCSSKSLGGSGDVLASCSHFLKCSVVISLASCRSEGRQAANPLSWMEGHRIWANTSPVTRRPQWPSPLMARTWGVWAKRPETCWSWGDTLLLVRVAESERLG